MFRRQQKFNQFFVIFSHNPIITIYAQFEATSAERNYVYKELGFYFIRVKSSEQNRVIEKHFQILKKTGITTRHIYQNLQ